MGLDIDDIDDTLYAECEQNGGLSVCVDLALDALKNDCTIERHVCPTCGLPYADEHANISRVCNGCLSISMSCPEAVGNPLGDRICVYWELIDEFDTVADRMGQLLVGKYSLEVEPKLFDLLLFA